MTNPDDDGPWRRDAPPRRPTIGFILWLALLAAVGLVVWQLASMFPGSLTSEFDQANLIQIIAVIAFVSSGLIFVRRVNVKETVRNVALWVGIAAVLILGLSYRDEIERIAMRVRSELVPGYALSTGENALTLTASADAGAVPDRHGRDRYRAQSLGRGQSRHRCPRTRLLACISDGEWDGARRALYAR